MVHVVQLLCPQRHCVLACFYEEGKGTFAEAKETIEKGRVKLNCNPWCAICGSRDLQYEDRTTIHKTMEEAAPHIAENALQCAITRAYFERHKARQN